MLRRVPEAILTALKMDPARVELYVEGERDRMFLTWILGACLPQNARIIPITFVDIPDVEKGGERGRLLSLAQGVGPEQERIRFFADADFDRLLERDVPALVWLTDCRDLEGYVISLDCIDRVLRLALAVDEPTAEQVREQIYSYGRRLGLLRLLSEVRGLDLPFQHSDLRRHVRWNGARLELRFQRYLQSLLQNAGITLNRLEEVNASLRELTLKHETTANSQIIHGKDAFCITERFLEKVGIRKDEGERLLWCSFERRAVQFFPILGCVVGYLKA